MKRDAVWWARLTKDERSQLIVLERAEHRGGSSVWLPDDCSECGSCGNPTLGIGLCSNCSGVYYKLLSKANGLQVEAAKRRPIKILSNSSIKEI